MKIRKEVRNLLFLNPQNKPQQFAYRNGHRGVAIEFRSAIYFYHISLQTPLVYSTVVVENEVQTFNFHNAAQFQFKCLQVFKKKILNFILRSI